MKCCQPIGKFIFSNWVFFGSVTSTRAYFMVNNEDKNKTKQNKKNKNKYYVKARKNQLKSFFIMKLVETKTNKISVK